MTLVRSVQLLNFRGFREHTVSLDPLSILVGQNNAGKSTFIDALRLLAVAVRKSSLATLHLAPDWLDGEAGGYGFRTTFETVDFDFENIHYNHENERPAKLQLLYVNKSRVTLWLGRDLGQNFIQIETLGQNVAQNRSDIARAALSSILVMPPISMLARHEIEITPSRVKEYMYGRLASRHFRNQLWQLVPAYRQWKDQLEQTWPSATVKSFERGHGQSGKELSLILREGPFASEAASVGSGLQAWMQILWFICRADLSAFVVLDEPDVFLHADMQRKIIKIIVARQFEQVAIATHSPEMISDVEPGSINVIRKRERYSSKPGKKIDVQDIIDQLGSRHNIQLGKLAAARKLVLYEGDDQKFLSQIALLTGDSHYQRFLAVPHFDIKGVDNWHQAIGAAKTLHASTEGTIPAYLIVDRDYRLQDELDELDELAKICTAHGLIFHPWSRKEIENYFVDAAIISRLITRRSKKNLDLGESKNIIDRAAESLIDYTIDAIADKWQGSNSKAMPSTARAEGKAIFATLQSTRKLEHIVSGKRLIREISKITQAEFGTQVNAMALCREFKLDELDSEIVSITKTLSS